MQLGLRFGHGDDTHGRRDARSRQNLEQGILVPISYTIVSFSEFGGIPAMPSGPNGAWSDILTVDQVAAYLHLNRLTVYRYIREGRLRASKVGKAYRIRQADVDWFLDSMRTPLVRPTNTEERPEPVTAKRPDPVAVAPRVDSADLRHRELTLSPMEG